MENYNKLLEKAKETYKNCATEGEKEILKSVFPELAVLDEEEIKNMLKAAINQTAWLDSDKNLCYSWLEKQEKKSVNKLQVGDELYEHIRNTCACIDDALIIETLKYKNDYLSMAKHSAQSAFDMIEKQREQKPVTINNLQWDELTWEDINTLEGIINNVHSEFRNGIGVESFGKEVLERFREIKGDEYMDACEQKSVEWSEEDKLNHKQAIYVCHQNGYNAVENWLKSLKPQNKWKPTEEQLSSLKQAISYFGGELPKELQYLYNDLQKLLD